MTHDLASTTPFDDEPPHAASPTAHLLEELQLYGYHPSSDEPDPRPLPDPGRAEGQIGAAVEALAGLVADTRLEPDLDDLLSGLVHVFHRRIGGLDRLLDENERRQRSAADEQDGSEVKSLELERLTAQGVALTERRNAFEAFREIACAHYEAATGSAWRPRAGSHVSRRALTSAMIDSRDWIAAKRRAEIEPLTPAGAKIAFTGGVQYNDHARIWAALDKARAKHPDMVLLHGGATQGAEKIAALWADARKVAQIVFKPDWRLGKAAPFKRNDALLAALPIGVIAFPGAGVSANLADKARAMGIPVMRFGAAEGGA